MSDVHSAAGSYAVDALSPAERAEFEIHLAGCGSCQVEVAEFAETLAALSPLTATAPPATLRASVLASVGSAAEQAGRRLAAPAVNGVGHHVEEEPEVAPRRARPRLITELRPSRPDEVAPLEEHPSVLPDTPWLEVSAALSQEMAPPPRRREKLLGVLLAAALVLAAALGGWAYTAREQNRVLVAQAQRENDLLTAPDAEVHTAAIDGAPVSFIVSEERDRALFLGNRLDDPGRGEAYQLWLIQDGTPVPAGLVGEGGSVREEFQGVRDADRLAVTLEPSSGSAEPTSPLLCEVTLSS